MPNLSSANTFLLTLGATLLVGCSHVPDIKNPTPIVAKPIWDGNRPEFCIALSGGGIRSGAVSLGVLQALHERGLLTKADIISTVSGGGYPVYGLVAAKVKNPTLTLDSLLKSGSAHIKRSEEMAFIDKSDAIFSGAMGAAQALAMQAGRLLGPTPDLVESASVVFPYAIDIHDTFVGYPAPLDRGVSLAGSKDFVNGLHLPYWIIQTSASEGIRPPPASHRYNFGDVFELSPDWIGSDNTGYMRSFISRLTLMDSVVSSAAAIDTPSTDDTVSVVPNWAKYVGFGLGAGIYLQDGSQVFLSDGGFIDNQAVIPLFRRNCKTILALDASHDPQATMKGWSIVTRYLLSRGWQVVLPHYIENQGMPVRPKDAWNLPSHLFVLSGVDPKGHESTVIVMKLGIAPNSVPNYPLATREFWLHQLTAWQGTPRCDPGHSRWDLRCTFPQQATVMQDFAPAEFRAYRCLGYHMVQEFLASSAAGKFERTGTVQTIDDCGPDPSAMASPRLGAPQVEAFE